MRAAPKPLPDAHFAQGAMSAQGRSVMARSEADEDRLRQLLFLLSPPERRAFWLGALVRDGAVTVEQVLRAKQIPKGHEPGAVSGVRWGLAAASGAVPQADAL